MAQLERKIGIQADALMDAATRDYEMASLDDSDFNSSMSGEEGLFGNVQASGHGGMHRVEYEGGIRFPVKLLLWFLLVVHMSGLFIWFRVWVRDRRVKAARTGKMTPPPQRQSCTYDVDSRFISKLELPLKALKLARA